MICYRCGSVLGSGRYCLHCGANIALYRKIVRISNSYYNSGLEKAKVRNLTGAIRDLNRSLEYNKKNIQARNLLGLCYYEVGEVVEALCQWVVSRNDSPYNNPAEEFIDKVRSDRRELDSQNQAIRKYNQALETIRHDGSDLAVIQLRNVVNQHPHFIKAHQLLALLYINDQEYGKAGKLLKHALQIDKGNVTCLRYASQITGKIGKRKLKEMRFHENEVRKAAEEVIIPEQKKEHKLWAVILGAALSAVICITAYYTLVKPSYELDLTNRLTQNEIAYNEKTEIKDTSLQQMEKELMEIKEELEMNNRQMALFTGDDGSITNYDRLLDALTKFEDEDWPALIETYMSINPEIIETAGFLREYEKLGAFVNSDEILDRIMEEAVNDFNAYQYAKVRQVCQTCLDINPDYVKAIYYMAMAYEADGDDASAAGYFQDIADRFPDSEYYEQAKRRLT